MARFTLKRSLREESCCSLLVVNGGVALRRRSFFSTLRTSPVGMLREPHGFFLRLPVPDFDLLFALADEAGVERGRLAGRRDGRRWSNILSFRTP